MLCPTHEIPDTLGHSALSTQHCALSTVHSALCTQHCAPCTEHCALCTALFLQRDDHERLRVTERRHVAPRLTSELGVVAPRRDERPLRRTAAPPTSPACRSCLPTCPTCPTRPTCPLRRRVSTQVPGNPTQSRPLVDV